MDLGSLNIDNVRFLSLMRAFKKHRDLDRLMLECAEWTDEIIKEMRFLPLPAKPAEVEEFEKMPTYDRERLTADFFRDHPRIAEYMEDTRKVRQANQSTYDWLVECQGILEKHGKDTRQIMARLEEVEAGQLWSGRLSS